MRDIWYRKYFNGGGPRNLCCHIDQALIVLGTKSICFTNRENVCVNTVASSVQIIVWSLSKLLGTLPFNDFSLVWRQMQRMNLANKLTCWRPASKSTYRIIQRQISAFVSILHGSFTIILCFFRIGQCLSWALLKQTIAMSICYREIGF